MLTGHTDQVRAVAWGKPNVVWTGSYDHTVRAWDVETVKRENPTGRIVVYTVWPSLQMVGNTRTAVTIDS